jgi:hypothetical protein
MTKKELSELLITKEGPDLLNLTPRIHMVEAMLMDQLVPVEVQGMTPGEEQEAMPQHLTIHPEEAKKKM